ncbi:hypothetical protein POF50_029930 [Streptomyces sp. SL13]|uniref:Uncharacterized protein n=1 Tax=Streptantibioticus silvisoli TaxID=2705255 RepID=A0AA90KBM5_9ACTN|nr:hypothetical protein [Streptantibioticus silvisoli]MDI5973512.1 hypothetical protein [Streptantibioticus silvisoli]
MAAAVRPMVASSVICWASSDSWRASAAAAASPVAAVSSRS